MVVIFDTCGMVEEAKKNACSLVGVDVCPPHITAVWDAISDFIIQQICMGHGVKIPGLGMITYKVFRSDVSHSKNIVHKIPLILLSENLVQKYALKAKRPPFNLDITETPLNMSAIAAMVCLPRAMVETCVEEVVQAFARALVEDNHVEFHLPRIGRIVVQCCQVSYYFNKDFLCRFDFANEVIQDKLCPAINCCPPPCCPTYEVCTACDCHE